MSETTIVSVTPEIVSVMLLQLQHDRTTAYWGTPPHSEWLDGAESWLLSLQDHLGGGHHADCKTIERGSGRGSSTDP